MRTGTARSLHSWATSLMCSGRRMLPGLSRRQCTPASSAASANLYWWWMSATTGTGERGTIRASPSAASRSLQVQRTMLGPARHHAYLWASVPSTSAVFVIVIDCTDTGASPPTTTGLVGWARVIWRVFRRSWVVVTIIGSLRDRRCDVEVDRAHEQQEEHRHHEVGEWQELGDVD